MNEIAKIAGKLEAKLQKLEGERERVAEQVRSKRATVAQLEAALNKLRSFEKTLS